MSWESELASPGLEKAMEAKDLPESDRDEVRRFAEYLRWCKERKLGPVKPLSDEARAWLLGKDDPEPAEEGAVEDRYEVQFEKCIRDRSNNQLFRLALVEDAPGGQTPEELTKKVVFLLNAAEHYGRGKDHL